MTFQILCMVQVKLTNEDLCILVWYTEVYDMKRFGEGKTNKIFYDENGEIGIGFLSDGFSLTCLKNLYQVL